MKQFVTCLVLFLSSLSASAQLSGYETYDNSDRMINGTVDRADYYTKYSFFGSTLNKVEFLQTADRSKGVVVYAHGCGRNSSWDRDVRKFYLELGYNFVDADFISRGDTAASCSLIGNTFIYRTNVHERLKSREKELSAHIKFLRANGFEKIVAVGFSEGGMVVQMLSEQVSSAVIHSMACVPTWYPPNPNNRTLRFISKRDPVVMPRWNYHVMLCDGHDWYKNFTNIVTNVDSHAPLADESIKPTIASFINKT